MLRTMLTQLCPPMLVHAWRRLSRTASLEENEIQRLRGLESRGETSLLGKPFVFLEPKTFLGLYRGIFKDQHYRFRTQKSVPYIVDCGANIGVSVAFWKSLYPHARIMAIEPDPVHCNVLRTNCAYLDDVVIHEAAAWTNAGEMPFYSVSSLGGHLSAVSPRTESRVHTVKTIRLRDFLTQPVDLLKLDIEGAEVDVLLDCAPTLRNVERLFVEHHSFRNKPQRLAEMFKVLESAGFRMHVHVELPASMPFVERPIVNEKDLRLAVFAFRE